MMTTIITPGSATLTVLTTDRGIVTKEILLGDDGEPVKKSTPNFSGGSYEVKTVSSIKDFASLRQQR